MRFILEFLAIGLISYGLTRAIIFYALRNLLDIPNERSSHTRPTPRGGGLAIVLSFYCGLSILSVDWMAMAGGIAVAAVGFWDDHKPLPARSRFSVHLIAAAWLVYQLNGLSSFHVLGDDYALGLIGNAGAVIFIAWMLNLFNFMDGIDGICGSEVIFVALSAAFLLQNEQQALMLALLAFATLGFTVLNWPPAKIFMGDVGSGFLGFMLGSFAIMTQAELSLCVWLILSGVFFVDASWTLARRMFSGQPWYQAHRSHAYQKASQMLGSHQKVTLAVLAINLFWLLPLAKLAVTWPHLELIALMSAYAPLSFLAFRLGAGRAE